MKVVHKWGMVALVVHPQEHLVHVDSVAQREPMQQLLPEELVERAVSQVLLGQLQAVELEVLRRMILEPAVAVAVTVYSQRRHNMDHVVVILVQVDSAAVVQEVLVVVVEHKKDCLAAAAAAADTPVVVVVRPPLVVRAVAAVAAVAEAIMPWQPHPTLQAQLVEVQPLKQMEQ